MQRKIHIFFEFSIISLVIITAIIVIYTIAQVALITLFSKEHQKDSIENRYEVLCFLLSNINIDEYTINNIARYDEQNIRMYKEDFSECFASNYDEDIWENIDFYFGRDVKIETEYISDDIYSVLSGPIYINGERYILQIVSDEYIGEDLLESYYPTFFAIFIFGIILSILGSIHLSKKFLRKLNRLSNDIEEVKEFGISHRMNKSNSNDEFDRIVTLFNSMMDEIECSFEEQTVFISNASHELRTPLTALKGHLSMIKRWGKNDKERMEKSIDICIDETDRLIKIVNDLLLLTRCEREIINLDEINEIKVLQIILDCVNHYKILNENIQFDIDVKEEDCIKITHEHLKQLLVIFIDNSIKYNDKEICKIKISLTQNNGRKELSITDNGMGIPQNDIQYVLNKFYKVDKSRVNNNSYGIGLSIANQIVTNYKGKINIFSTEKVYTTIKILL